MFNQDTQRLVRIFQKVFHLRDVERDQVKYVKRYAEQIKWAGRLFEYLGLAEPDKQSPLGWRPTPLLLHVMNKQSARKSKPSKKPIPILNKLIVIFIGEAVIGDEAHDGVLSLGYEVLHELAFVREDPEGELGATPRLIRLLVEVYYDPDVPHDRRRGASLFAPIIRPKQPL